MFIDIAIRNASHDVASWLWEPTLKAKAQNLAVKFFLNWSNNDLHCALKTVLFNNFIVKVIVDRLYAIQNWQNTGKLKNHTVALSHTCLQKL